MKRKCTFLSRPAGLKVTVSYMRIFASNVTHGAVSRSLVSIQDVEI